MNKTSIEWAKNPDGSQGYTWNPITGCLNGCEYCYARKLANTRLKERYLVHTNLAPRYEDDGSRYNLYEDCHDPFYPRFWPERIPEDRFCSIKAIERKKAKPKGIFVCDMGELFGDWVPIEWQEEIFRVITFNSWHRFYLLTKQGQNLARWTPFPDNCWVGVTATGYKAFNEALDHLKGIEAKVKFISIEPLLEAIPFYMERLAYCGINWVIIGAQTKPTVMPKIEWVQGIVEAADRAGVAVFLKDNLKPLLNYPATTGFLKQEMPNK